MLQSTITLKIALNSGLLLIILAFGRVLHTTGRPYLTGLFTAHQVATVALAGYLILILSSYMKNSGTTMILTVWLITGTFFLLILLLTGLFLYHERHLIPSLWLHRLATAGFIISLAGILWNI
ncbi:MAG: hypothetical protein R6W81_04850 [Bacteroidales bacterium]